MRKISRIIHVLDSLDLAMGGPPVAVAGLAAAQASLGHNVTIIANKSQDTSRLITDTVDEFPGLEKVTIHLVPNSGLVDRLTGRAAEKILFDTVTKDDVIHLHGIWRPILGSAAKAAKLSGARYICAPLGMLHPWALRQKRFKKQLALLLGWRSIINHAEFLHVLNQSEADHMNALGFVPGTRIIPNGIFPEQIDLAPDASEFLAKFPALSSRPYILFLGRLHHVKGLDYVAASFSIFSDAIKDVDLVVAGPDGGAREDFLAEIERLGIQSRVHMVGPLYGTVKYAAMRGAACLFQPSRQEGFSMAITEAMACGLPVVISDQCNFPEIATAGAGEIVMLDSNKFGKALIKIINNEEERKAMGVAARDLVLRNYTWPAIASMSLAAYADIIPGPG